MKNRYICCKYVIAIIVFILILKFIQFYFAESFEIVINPIRNTNRYDNVPLGLYVINLERRKDRMKDFLIHFDRSDLRNYKLLQHRGIDGSTLDIKSILLSERARNEFDELTRTNKRKYMYQLSIGAIGCYFSHVQLWETTILNNHMYSIILEDDFAIPVNMIEEIEILIKRIPEDWDIILLHHHISEYKQENGYRIVQRFQGTAAYMISNKGAKKMFESGLLFPMTQQIDAFMSEMSSVVNIYASQESISHAGGETDVQVKIEGDEQWNRYLLNHGT